MATTLVIAAMVAVSPMRADTKLSADIRARNAAAKPVRPDAAPFVIVAFGSSSTAGTGATTPDRAYPAQAQRLFVKAFGTHPAVVVVNRGVGGEDIDDMTKRLRADVLARTPDLVVWQAGSNDILHGVPLERFTAELGDGVAAIRATGAEVILMEPQWCPSLAHRARTLRFVNAMRAFAAARHVPLVRRYDLMQDWVEKGLVPPNKLVGRDGLHMTDQGYELLAKAVFEQIRSTSSRFRATVATLGPQHL